MRDLIERVRALRKAGRDVSVIAFDALRNGMTRDAAMADKLLSSLQDAPRMRLVVLVGNLHAMKSIGSPFDPLFEPMAYYLAAANPTSLNVDFAGGAAWNCQSTCAAHEFSAKSEALRRPPGFYPEHPGRPGFDGTVVLATATSSAPASRGRPPR